MVTVTDFIFLNSKITTDGDWSLEIKRCLLLGRKAMTDLDSILKSKDITLLTKVHIVKATVFSVVMYRCESWTIKKAEHQGKKWCFQIVVLKKTLESPLDSMEIKPVNPKGNQPWILIGRTNAEAEAPILWPPNATSRLTGRDPDAGKDWRQKEKMVTEDKMVDSITDSMDMNLNKFLDRVEDKEAWHGAVHGVAKSRTRLSDWRTRLTGAGVCISFLLLLEYMITS